jgi:hypothetical protein
VAETAFTLDDIATLAALANGIIPADARDAGAAVAHAGAGIAERARHGINGPLYAEGLMLTSALARKNFGRAPGELNAEEIRQLLDVLAQESPAFFRQLRADTCGLYMSDPAVWQRIGFPGASIDRGGYPDFDTPQSSRLASMKTPQTLPAVQSFLARPPKMLIGGQWREAASGETMDSIDPATGRVLARVCAGGAADVDEAVRAARRAFIGPWRKITPHERGRLLQKAAALVEKHADELAELITLENGKPLWEARKEVGTAVSWTEYYAGWTTKLLGDTIPVSLPGQFLNYTVREPLGVVAGITPPNYPLTMPLYKAAPALATGNTIIIKPSEDTSLVPLRLAELFLEAGFPEGTFNVVTGMGETAGAALAEHEDVDKITFTGSTEVGRALVRASAGNLKKVSLELGGK